MLIAVIILTSYILELILVVLKAVLLTGLMVLNLVHWQDKQETSLKIVLMSMV